MIFIHPVCDIKSIKTEVKCMWGSLASPFICKAFTWFEADGNRLGREHDIENVCMEQKMEIEIGEEYLEPGKVGRCVRQGCTLSPKQFNNYTKELVRVAVEDPEEGHRSEEDGSRHWGFHMAGQWQEKPEWSTDNKGQTKFRMKINIKKWTLGIEDKQRKGSCSQNTYRRKWRRCKIYATWKLKERQC